ncbi:MAG TPA: hypothetical protein VLT62_24105 [Candidatus Methylomirabilis sp.]|nr:hypothetical protein [Candidatus Methylomirabilis sp.]
MDTGAMAGTRLDAEAASDRRRPLGHDAESPAVTPTRGRHLDGIEADPVVPDEQTDAARARLQLLL